MVHLFEIEELKKKTGHFGALFAQKLIAQEAFITKLSGDIAFLKQLVVKKLHIDSAPGNEDFEVDINEDIGISVRNKRQVVFEVSKTGNAIFTGDIRTPPFELIQGAIAPYNLIYNNELLANIIRGSKFQKNNFIPFLGKFSCGGTYKNKEIKGLEVYLKKNIGTKTYHNVYAETGSSNGYWGTTAYYYIGNVSYKTTKYILNIIFKDDTREVIQEELVDSETKTITITSDKIMGDVTEFRAPYSDTNPSKRLNNLIIEINNTATTMRLRNLPLGDGEYEVGTVYDEDGFLKIKR